MRRRGSRGHSLVFLGKLSCKAPRYNACQFHSHRDQGIMACIRRSSGVPAAGSQRGGRIIAATLARD